MKKFLLFMLAMYAFYSCQKKDANPVTTGQEVVFTAEWVNPGSLKSTNDWNWECDATLNPVYAEIEIYTNPDLPATPVLVGTFFPKVFPLGNNRYTQSLKLEPGNYKVTKFLVMDDMGTPNNKSDDQIYMATPETTLPPAAYSEYTNPDAPFPFTVNSFAKTEVPVQVLCFNPAVYQNFGFDWFQVTQIVIREQCFFGDFCMKHPADYAGSHYDLQEGPLMIDMPAIFKIMAYKKVNNLWELVPNNEDFTNDNAASNYGVGAPVCVKYPDNILIDNEQFKFELWILVKTGDSFNFVKFHQWLFEDEEMISDGTDGVVDFVLGSCNLSETDLQIPPYQNLPVTVDMTASYPGVYSYWNFNFTALYPPAPLNGYDFGLGNYAGWCGDESSELEPGTYTMYVFSSLYPTLWPPVEPNLQPVDFQHINWLFNHLGNYGIDINNNISLGNSQVSIQNAIWRIIDPAFVFEGTIAENALALQMVNDAVANGTGFVPLPGGWAGVLFFESLTQYEFQLIFMVVDP